MNVYQWIIIITIGIFFGFQGVYFIYTNNYINKKFNEEDRMLQKIHRNLQFIMANLSVAGTMIVITFINIIIGG